MNRTTNQEAKMYDDQNSRRPGAEETEVAASREAADRYPYGCEPAESGGWNVGHKREGRHVRHYNDEGVARQVCMALNIEATR